MITRKDQHEEQVNTESADSDDVWGVRSAEMPLSSRNVREVYWETTLLPLSFHSPTGSKVGTASSQGPTKRPSCRE